MHRDSSCLRAFHGFLTPSFVLSGNSAKSRCLGKLSHPSSLIRQVKTVIFISKITISAVEGCVLAEEHIVASVEN